MKLNTANRIAMGMGLVMTLAWGGCLHSRGGRGTSSLAGLMEVDAIRPPNTLADWLRLKHLEIQSRTSYLEALKTLTTGLQQYHESAGRVSEEERVAFLKRLMISQGEAMQEAGATIAAIDQAAHEKAASEADAPQAGSRERLSGFAAGPVVIPRPTPKPTQSVDDQVKLSDAELRQRQAESQMALQWAQAQAQLASQYGALSNQKMEQWIANSKGGLQNDRMAVDNEGARIDNFGKVLSNQGKSIENYNKALDNVLKELEVVLKSYYIMGYRRYVQAYATYTSNINKVWYMIGKSTEKLGRVLKDMRSYETQTALCESRANRVLSQRYREANQELRGKTVSYSNVADTMRYLASTTKGEECLHKVLLTSQFTSVGELFNIRYQIAWDGGPKVALNCPSIEGLVTDEGMSAMNYPPVVLDPASSAMVGVYQPTTYYQLYRLVTETAARVTIAPPGQSDQLVCEPRVPGTVSYLNESRRLEKALAESFAVNASQRTVRAAGYAPNFSSIPSANTSYRSLVDRMTMVFQRVAACQASDDTFLPPPSGGDTPTVPVAKPADPTKLPPVDAPMEVGKPARSELGVFFDPDFPLMSETVRDCMRMAEHYRYKAFSQMETYERMYSILQKATEMKPPRAPHPTQFMPAPAGTLPGNN